MLAGLFVALGFATRPPWLMVPLFFLEVARASAGGARCGRPRAGARSARRRSVLAADRGGRAPFWRVLNAARFGSPFEFGHKFLDVQWQERMSASVCSTTTSCRATSPPRCCLLPRLMTHAPYVKISQHGMSMLVTSPNLAYTVMPQARSH